MQPRRRGHGVDGLGDNLLETERFRRFVPNSEAQPAAPRRSALNTELVVTLFREPGHIGAARGLFRVETACCFPVPLRNSRSASAQTPFEPSLIWRAEPRVQQPVASK